MGSTLPLLYNIRNSLIELSSSLSYLYSLYSMYSDVYAILSLSLCLVPCMIRCGAVSRTRPRLRYTFVCSSVMSVHPKGRDSARGIRVSIVSAGVVLELSRVAGCGAMLWLVEVGGRWCGRTTLNYTGSSALGIIHRGDAAQCTSNSIILWVCRVTSRYNHWLRIKSERTPHEGGSREYNQPYKFYLISTK